MVSLFSSLNTGRNALTAQTAAIRTTGHNIANATTPGYSRQRAELHSQRPDDIVFAQVGTGVRLAGIRRIVDETLQIRIQEASAELGNLGAQATALKRLEAAFNELSEGDLSSSINRFFAAVQDLTVSPEDPAVRSTVIRQGETLADDMRGLRTRIGEVRAGINEQVRSLVPEINDRVLEIAQLNEEVVRAEDGGIHGKAANDLRDRRELLLRELADMVEIRTFETSTGSVNVLAGNDYLVYDDDAFLVEAEAGVDRGQSVHNIVFQADGAAVDLDGGELAGLVAARDGEIGDTLDALDALARTFIHEFNRVHTQGRGLVEFSEVTSVQAVAPESFTTVPLTTNSTVTDGGGDSQFTDSTLAGRPDDFFNGVEVVFTSGANAGERAVITDFLGSSGTIFLDRDMRNPIRTDDEFSITSLPTPPENGRFELIVRNRNTGEERTLDIDLDFDRAPSGAGNDDTTLQDLVDEINAEVTAAFPSSPVVASRTVTGRLEIESADRDFSFAFGEDTSGILTSLGINTFFTGDSAGGMDVNPRVVDDERLVAAARTDAPGDNSNALAMAEVETAAFGDLGGRTLDGFYNALVGEVGAAAASAEFRAENQRVLAEQLDAERERISGVNIDEEAIDLITHQRAFQAAARYLSVVDNLLDVLINAT